MADRADDGAKAMKMNLETHERRTKENHGPRGPDLVPNALPHRMGARRSDEDFGFCFRVFVCSLFGVRKAEP